MRTTPSTDPAERFESDRDVLPFPVGGVFAGQKPPAPESDGDDVQTTSAIAANIEQHLEAMQRNIDALAEALDDPIPFETLQRGATPEDDDDDRWPAA